MSKKKRRPMGYWTQDRVIAAMRRWKREHGKFPLNNDWMNSGSYWPAQTTVYRVFPSWVAAVEAAGPSKPKAIEVEPRGTASEYDLIVARITVMESNLNRQMAELRMMLDRETEPVVIGNGHSDQPDLISRILGRAA
jgi:hypothetical protein